MNGLRAAHSKGSVKNFIENSLFDVLSGKSEQADSGTQYDNQAVIEEDARKRQIAGHKRHGLTGGHKFHQEGIDFTFGSCDIIFIWYGLALNELAVFFYIICSHFGLRELRKELA